MPLQPLDVDPETARRFMRRALLFDTPVATVGPVISHLGFLQIDPINVCGRMHDLIARNRVLEYREGDLMRYLHGAEATLPPERRVAFEHHFPSDGAYAGILAAFPLDAWPYLRGAMRSRAKRPGAWSGRLTPNQRDLARRVLSEIAARGPLSSEDLSDPRRSRSVWGAATIVKATMQKLFFHGQLLIARRSGSNRRFYDLPERVLPDSIRTMKDASAEATSRWAAIMKLRQRRLVRLKRNELLCVEDLVQPVRVEGCQTLHLLKDDAPMLESLLGDRSSDRAVPDVRLLAPLDPLIYDRTLTASLWQFDYTWEAYTPPARRVRGYYAMPVLAGTCIVGHVDPKVDRDARRIRLNSRRVKRGHRVAGAVQQLSRFLGLRA
jgi:uncharacterized protein YcaQ